MSQQQQRVEKPPILEVWRCLWSSMGALDAICDELPEGPTGGRLRGYIEHGVPEILPYVERVMHESGVEIDTAEADKSFARGLQTMVLLRREEETGERDAEAWKQPPGEFLAEYRAALRPLLERSRDEREAEMHVHALR